MLGIGIDTGGTCTDAVIYDFETRTILGSGKALTTKQNLEIGIANALDLLPQELVKNAEMISLSTTLATNACLENKGARAKLLMIGFD
ncbi:MAG: hydantoinase/oxoprolinase family protein, partial [Lachnospiraceae bacterium]|nr:hydantoinase/oxoprolinase family protein [Lachnospiraceae bacterium]